MVRTPNYQNVIGTVYDSSRFMHHKDDKLFTSNVSSTREVLRQLWADSMDLGFGIRSHKTGTVAYFTLLDIERDDEGNITCFIFEPFRPVEALKDYRVRIYNT